MSSNRLPLLAVCLAIVVTPAAAQTVASPHDAHRLHQDPAAYQAALDDPARDAWQRPGEVVAALAFRDGEAVADIGAGSGYFTFRFVPHIGARGRVYAVDVDPRMIGAISARAFATGDRAIRPGAVAPIVARPDDPLLPAASIDTVFTCNTWHHIDGRGAYLAKVKAALLSGGRVVVIDFHKRDLPVGPPASMKLAREQVVSEFEQAGFSLAKEHTFLPHQYFLEFTVAAAR